MELGRRQPCCQRHRLQWRLARDAIGDRPADGRRRRRRGRRRGHHCRCLRCGAVLGVGGCLRGVAAQAEEEAEAALPRAHARAARAHPGARPHVPHLPLTCAAQSAPVVRYGSTDAPLR
eukprot:5604891-Pleurochrysis_carterae.AAC.1